MNMKKKKCQAGTCANLGIMFLSSWNLPWRLTERLNYYHVNIYGGPSLMIISLSFKHFNVFQRSDERAINSKKLMAGGVFNDFRSRDTFIAIFTVGRRFLRGKWLKIQREKPLRADLGSALSDMRTNEASIKINWKV